MEDTLTQRVIAVIARTRYIPLERISLETTFEELGMDSLDDIGLIFDLEEEFNIAIPNDRAPLIRTVRQAVEGLRTLLLTGETNAGAAFQS